MYGYGSPSGASSTKHLTFFDSNRKPQKQLGTYCWLAGLQLPKIKSFVKVFRSNWKQEKLFCFVENLEIFGCFAFKPFFATRVAIPPDQKLIKCRKCNRYFAGVFLQNRGKKQTAFGPSLMARICIDGLFLRIWDLFQVHYFFPGETWTFFA